MHSDLDLTPTAFFVAHHVPGRLRLKLLPEDGRAPLVEACRRLMAIPATISATPHPVTGSIVFRYDALAMPAANIFDALQERGFWLEARSRDHDSEIPLTRHLVDAVANRVCAWVVESLALAAIAAAT